jgi:hypothetical protein
LPVAGNCRAVPEGISTAFKYFTSVPAFLGTREVWIMFHKKTLWLWLLIGTAGAAAAHADEHQCYTAESIDGSWTVIGTFGANVALSIGERAIAESGEFTGTFVLNGPLVGSPTGARTITTGTQEGTYAVNCDGTGTITRILRSSTGVVATQVDDFVITKATMKHGRLLATGLTDVQRVPSALVPGGIFVTRTHTRLPGEER